MASGAGMLSHQAALITGAGRGIGAAAARLFAQHGCAVVVNDADAEAAIAVAQEITAAGGRAVSFPGDCTTDAFAADAVGHTIQSFGNINHLVNNAGFTWDSMLHRMSDEAFDAVIACHARAPFRLIRAAGEHMRTDAKREMETVGRPTEPRTITNVSSSSGLHGNVGQANYALAKAGIIGLSKTVAKEWGPLGIRCNAVAFGLIDTRLTRPAGEGGSVSVGGTEVPQGLPPASVAAWQTEAAQQQLPLRRAGSAEEAAGGILFLASPLASYVTGHVLEVTGGLGM